MPASDFNVGPTQGMGSGTVKVSPIKKNTEGSEKVAYLKVTIAGQSPKFIKLTQQTGDYVYEYEFVATNNIINFGANGGTRQATITSTRKSYMDGQLVSTEDWPFSVKEHDEGLQVDGINITMPENTSSMPGVKQVIYVQQDSGKEVVIECNQLGASVEEDTVFEVTPLTLNFEEGASTQSVTVTSQSIKIVNEGEQQVEDVPYTASPSASWITANGNQIGVTANPTTSPRSGTVTFTQEGTNASIVVTINQAEHIQIPGTKYFLFSELSPDLSIRPTVSGLELEYTQSSDQQLPDVVFGFKVDTLDGEVVVGDNDWSLDKWKELIQDSTEHISPLSSSEYQWEVVESDWVSKGSSYTPETDIPEMVPYQLTMYNLNISANNTLNRRIGNVKITVANSDKGSISYSITQASSISIGFADTNTGSINIGFSPGYDYTEESPEVQEQRFEILAYDKDTGERISLNGNLETYFTLNDPASSDLMNYVDISLSNNFLVIKPKTTGTYKLLSTYAGENGTVTYYIFLNITGSLNVKGSSLTLNFNFTNNTDKNTNQIVYLTDTTGSSNKGTDLNSGQIHRNTQVTINTYVMVKRSLITNDNAFSFMESAVAASQGNLYPIYSLYNPLTMNWAYIDNLITYSHCELYDTLSNGDLIYHVTATVNTHNFTNEQWNGTGSWGSLAIKGLQIRVGLAYKGMRDTTLQLAKEILTFVD